MQMQAPEHFLNANKMAVEQECLYLLDLVKLDPTFKAQEEDGKIAFFRKYLPMMRHVTQPHDVLIYATLWYLETYPEAYAERRVVGLYNGPRDRWSGLRKGEPYRKIDGKHGCYHVSVGICGGLPDGFC